MIPPVLEMLSGKAVQLVVSALLVYCTRYCASGMPVKLRET